MDLLVRIVTSVSCTLFLSLTALAEGEQQIADLGNCHLDNGGVIEDCRIGYRTFGELNDDRSNTLLLLTYYTGTTEDYFDSGAIGPEKLADTTRFFVVAVEALSNGISSSPSNSPAQAAEFPVISIGDMVDTQYRLLQDVLGIQHLHAVIGISMGGMQTYEWALRYPDFLSNAVPISGTPRQTSYDLLGWETQLKTIDSFASVDYESAVRIIAGMERLAAFEPQQVNDGAPVSEYESFVRKRVESARRFGLANRAPQLQAMIDHDISDSFDGSMENAAMAVTANMLIVVAASDHLVNPQPSRDFAKIKGSELFEMDGACGHVSALCERDSVAGAVNAFLPDP